MSNSSASVVICGAGIAGIAAAYYLAVEHGARSNDRRAGQSSLAHIGQIDRGLPQLVARPRLGDDRVHEPQHRSDRGDRARDRQSHQYEPPRLPVCDRRTGKSHCCETMAPKAEARGGGPARMHETAVEPYAPSPERGFIRADRRGLITDASLIRRHFPYLAPGTVAVAHARRAGWLSAQQLGMTMLEAPRARREAHWRQGGRRRHRRRTGARGSRGAAGRAAGRWKRRTSCSPRDRC